MNVIQNIFLFLHIVGAGIIVGIWFANIKTPTILPGQFHAALLQLISGIALVGIIEMSKDDGTSLNHFKIAVKLLITIMIVVIAYVGSKNKKAQKEISPKLAHTLGAATLLNIFIAIFW